MPFSNNFPYTDLHEININKFLKAIKNLLGGHGGEYLRKKSNIPFDYEWSVINGPSGSVTSVNGQTGAVVLDASDVGALPDTTFTTGSDGMWSWKKWSDGTLELNGYYSGPPTGNSHYTTIGPFYGYRVAGFHITNNVSLIDNNYLLLADWSIGSGFSISCGAANTKTTTGFTLYALSSYSGQTSVKINIYIRAKWR